MQNKININMEYTPSGLHEYPVSISSSEESEHFRRYVDSDNESTDTAFSDTPIPPPGWWDTYYSFGENLLSHKYIAESYSQHLIDNETFVHNVFRMISNMNRLYGDTLKAMYLPIQTLDQEGNTETIEIRFDVSEILRTHFIDDLKEFVEDGIAPLYVNLDTAIRSDSVTGRLIKYCISYVRFLVQKEPFSHMHVTRIIGNRVIHPGYYVKAISPSDHEVVYGKRDCVLICLNEHTKKNLKPEDVRARVWPGIPRYMSETKEFTRGRHLSALADIYQVSIKIYFIETKERLRFGDYSDFVQLIKIGKCVGIFEKYIVLEEEDNDKDFSRNTNIKVGFYDLETVQKSDDKMQRIYSYCIKIGDFVETICDYDVDVVEKQLVRTLRNLKGRIYLYAWNGSRFDSRILLPLLIREDVFCKSVVLNNANELLSFKLYTNDDDFVIFRDPCKLFPSTLSEASKHFELENFSKLSSVDHLEVETMYMKGGIQWEEYLQGKYKDVMEYVERDVRLLEKLFWKIYDVYQTGKICIPVFPCLSRSMASQFVWRKLISEEGTEYLKEFPKMPYDKLPTGILLHELRKHAVAGRVQATRFRGKASMIDVNSMYPHVAANEWYPCGAMKLVNKFVENKIGIYRVLIHKQYHPHVIPVRIKGVYDWTSDDLIDKYVTSVDVECLISSGAHIEIREGFVWEGKTKAYFSDYMNTLFELRKECKKGSSMDIHYKHMLNALTGAIFQEMLRDYAIIFTKEEADEMIQKYSSVISVVSMWEYELDKALCICRPKNVGEDRKLQELQKEVCRRALVSRPVILTMFIYSYARKLLWNTWRSIESSGGKVIYSDTDSLIFTGNIGGVDIGNGLGQWKIEEQDQDTVIIRPKTYAIGNKIRVKGVSTFSLCYNTKEEKINFKTMEEANKMFNAFPASEFSGPALDNLNKLYEGEKLVSVYWNMEKTRNGVVKKYVVKTIT